MLCTNHAPKALVLRSKFAPRCTRLHQKQKRFWCKPLIGGYLFSANGSLRVQVISSHTSAPWEAKGTVVSIGLLRPLLVSLMLTFSPLMPPVPIYRAPAMRVGSVCPFAAWALVLAHWFYTMSTSPWFFTRGGDIELHVGSLRYVGREGYYCHLYSLRYQYLGQQLRHA